MDQREAALISLETARQLGSPAKIGETLHTLYADGMGQGLADLDLAAVKKVIESVHRRGVVAPKTTLDVLLVPEYSDLLKLF